MAPAHEVEESLASPLEMFYHRESQHGSKVAFVQPYPDGSVKEFTWKDAGEQVRKMASYLHAERSELAS